MADLGAFVYWERQLSDLLCGLHCLNNLLQFPAFDEASLAAIGIELDKKESALLGTKVLNNVNDSGYFSLQVLVSALSQFANFEVDSIKSQRHKGKPLTDQEAFVCHNDNHWFCIRKIHGKWFNLNSTNKTGPQLISDFYFTLFIDSIADNGYQIFVVSGNFPHFEPSVFAESLNFNQRYYAVGDVEKQAKEDMKNSNFKLNINSGDSEALDYAIKQSMETYKQETQNAEKKEESKSKNAKPDLKTFLQGNGVTISAAPVSKKQPEYFPGEDEESVMAVRMSLDEKYQAESPEDLAGPLLKIRLPDGSSAQRHFEKSKSISEVYEFVFWKLGQGNRDFTLFKPAPKEELPKSDKSLSELGLTNQESLICSLKD